MLEVLQIPVMGYAITP